MTQMNFSTYHHLEAYYSSKILQLAKKIGKKATVWQGNFFIKTRIKYFKIWSHTLNFILIDVYDNGVKVNLEYFIEIK